MQDLDDFDEGEPRLVFRGLHLTIGDFRTIAQNVKNCQVCGQTFDPNHSREPVVDMHPETGQVRGLLCFSCHTGIELFENDPELIRKAIQHVEAFVEDADE